MHTHTHSLPHTHSHTHFPPHSRTLSHAHSLTDTVSHTLSHTHTFPHTHSHTLTCTLPLTRSLSPYALPLTHTLIPHTHTLSCTHIYIHTPSHTVSHTHSYTFTLSHTVPLTHAPSHAPSLSHIRSHTHSPLILLHTFTRTATHAHTQSLTHDYALPFPHSWSLTLAPTPAHTPARVAVPSAPAWLSSVPCRPPPPRGNRAKQHDSPFPRQGTRNPGTPGPGLQVTAAASASRSPALRAGGAGVGKPGVPRNTHGRPRHSPSPVVPARSLSASPEESAAPPRGPNAAGGEPAEDVSTWGHARESTPPGNLAVNLAVTV